MEEVFSLSAQMWERSFLCSLFKIMKLFPSHQDADNVFNSTYKTYKVYIRRLGVLNPTLMMFV